MDIGCDLADFLRETLYLRELGQVTRNGNDSVFAAGNGVFEQLNRRRETLRAFQLPSDKNHTCCAGPQEGCGGMETDATRP